MRDFFDIIIRRKKTKEEGKKLDISSMRYFIAAAEHLNFTKAAQFCYITQTAMSVAIAKMEKEVGATLFNRSNKKIELTEAGKLFYEQVTKIVRSYDEAICRVQDIDQRSVKQLTILFPHIAEANLFEPIINRFLEKYPEIKINVSIKDPTRFQSYISKNSNTLAICWESGSLSPEETDCIVITSYLENIFMGKRHPLANHEKITAEEINKETFAWLSPKDYPEEYDKMRKSWQTVGIAPEKIVFHNTEGELFGAILYQHEITSMPSFYAKIVPDRFVSMPINTDNPILTPILGYYKKNHMTSVIKSFLEEAQSLL
jgi:DNA-binding transcriptional LysR family regulator